MIGIQINDNGDVLLKVRHDASGKIAGGLVIAESIYQNQALLLHFHAGELKEHPAVGVGITDMLLDDDFLLWKSRIREQLEMDNQRVNSVKITTDSIMIDAKYN